VSAAAPLVVAVVTLLWLAAPPPTAAPHGSAPVAEARKLFRGYHRDLGRIDRARDLLERAITEERTVDALILLARTHLAWADLRAQTAAEKLAGYERGRDVAKLATELAPRNPDAHLWYAANLGRWATLQGRLRSALLLPTINTEIRIILDLAPEYPAGLALAGTVALETPRLLGGDPEQAEEYQRKALAADPHFTRARVELARCLIEQGRVADARKELRRVLKEKRPTSYADWAARHRPTAERLLREIEGDS